MTNLPDYVGGRWLEAATVPTFFVPAPGEGPRRGAHRGELSRARSAPEYRQRGPRELQVAKHYGGRGPGAVDIARVACLRATGR